MTEPTSHSLLDFSGFSITTFVEVLSIILFTLSSILFIQVVALRITGLRRIKLKNEFNGRWKPVLMHALYGEILPIPTLKKHECIWLIVEWNKIYETFKGESTNNLDSLKNHIDIMRVMKSLLKSKKYNQKILGILFSGHTKNTESWLYLSELIKDRSPIVSLLSARSLMKINKENAITIFLKGITDRKDWPIDRVIDIYRKHKTHRADRIVAGKINAAQRNRNIHAMSQLIPLLPYINRRYTFAIKKKLFENPIDDKVISELIKLIDSPFDLPYLNQFCWSDRWHVRLHAINAYGRVATEEQLPVFEEFLSDSEWWVRYRSAEALIDSRIVDTEYLITLSQNHPDRYARDMLTYVLAERNIQ